MSLYLDSFHLVPMHIMKTLHSLFVIGLLTTSLFSQATAANSATNNQAKIDLVKKVETFAKKPFPRQPEPKQRFSAVFVSNIH